MDTENFWQTCRTLFVVVIVLTSLTSLWRLRNWNVRTNRYVQPDTAVVSPCYCAVGMVEVDTASIIDYGVYNIVINRDVCVNFPTPLMVFKVY